jgi:hypothetical protein
MKHTPDTGSIARPGGLQPNALPIELRLLPLHDEKHHLSTYD